MLGHVLKINASPAAIESIGIEEIKTKIIPEEIENSFSRDGAGRHFLSITSLDVELLDELFNLTEKVKDEYSKILDAYKNAGEISYNKEYLKLIEHSKRLRHRLEFQCPAIKSAYYMSDNDAKSLLTILTDGHIGTGIDHMLKMAKIRDALDKKTITSSSKAIFFYYKGKSEHIIADLDDENPLQMARRIEDNLNRGMSKDARRKIGKVRINPVYESVKILKSAENTAPTILVSFPNGDTSDEFETLLSISRRTGAESLELKLSGADNNTLESMVQPISRKGYLRDILQGKRSIIDVKNSNFAKEHHGI